MLRIPLRARRSWPSCRRQRIRCFLSRLSGMKAWSRPAAIHAESRSKFQPLIITINWQYVEWSFVMAARWSAWRKPCLCIFAISQPPFLSNHRLKPAASLHWLNRACDLAFWLVFIFPNNSTKAGYRQFFHSPVCRIFSIARLNLTNSNTFSFTYNK